jgi:hypothetical protein
MAAPKGNRFALGHGFGRPPMYTTPEEMVEKAKEYFEIETNTSGICKPTISGLMFHLGFSQRQSFYDYKAKSEDFAYTCNYLITFIESCYEKNLHGFAWAGSCFALKNINSKDWKDEVTQNQNQVVTKVEIVEKKRDA